MIEGMNMLDVLWMKYDNMINVELGWYMCDDSIPGTFSICVMHEILEFSCLIMLDYDWCVANPEWSVVDRLPICMNG